MSVYVKVSLLFIYLFVSVWIFFTSSLWLLYFGLELQWMLFIVFFISGNSIWRGLINYVIFNEILGTFLVLGLVCSVGIFFTSLYYGKIGFYPFIIPMITIINNVSYLYFLFDPINKFCYFGSYFSFYSNFSDLSSLSSSSSIFIFMIIIINFNMIYVFGIKLVSSIKVTLLISSLINFLLIVILILVQSLLFAVVYFILYYFNLIMFISALVVLFDFTLIPSSKNNYTPTSPKAKVSKPLTKALPINDRIIISTQLNGEHSYTTGFTPKTMKEVVAELSLIDHVTYPTFDSRLVIVSCETIDSFKLVEDWIENNLSDSFLNAFIKSWNN